MTDITVVGFGPGPWEKVTLEAAEILLQAERIYFKDPTWEVYRHLEQRGKRLIRLHHLYTLGLDYLQIYRWMADILVSSARLYGPIVFAQAGNPFFFEKTTPLLLERAGAAGLSTRVVEGMSCLDTIFVEHRIDPVDGLQLVNYFQLLEGQPLAPGRPALIFQVGAPTGGWPRLDMLRLEAQLQRYWPRGHQVYLLAPALDSTAQERLPLRLGEMSQHLDRFSVYSTLYVPAHA